MSEPSGDVTPGGQSSEDAPDPPLVASSARPDVFGDVLPDQTSDERAGGADWRAGEDGDSDRDEELRRDVPPHY